MAGVAVLGGVLAFTVGVDRGTARPMRFGAGPAVTDPSVTPTTVAVVAPGKASPTTTSVTMTTQVPAPPTTVPDRLTAASRLSLDGVGPVRVGMTLREASAAAGAPIQILDDVGGEECRYAVAHPSSGTADELGFMIVAGRIVRVDVRAMGPGRIRTVSGIGKGSTEAEVRATYPGRIRVEPHPYILDGHYLVYVPRDVGLRSLSMIFETIDGKVQSFRSGFAEQVSWTEGCS